MAQHHRWLRCGPTLLLGAVACGATALGGLSPPGAPHESGPEFAAVRRTWPTEGKAFEKWLRQTLVPGRTTQNEVIAIFGRGYIDLDRPARDSITSIEYDLRKLRVRGGGRYLVLDFTPGRRLLRWYDPAHLSICGFCPHVFADDGRWRLEGKALAGCVGAEREGTDTLLLPRLTARDGRLRVRLVNLAPEVEYIDHAALGCVPLSPGEEMDTDRTGRPFAWAPTREVPLPPLGDAVPLGGPGEGRVLVLEVRNTSAFEAVMRAHLLEGAPAPPASLKAEFDDGSVQAVQPVGTKFLRRGVLTVPRQARGVRLRCTGALWQVPRLWVGRGRDAEAAAVWLAAESASGPAGPVAPLLREQDGRRLRLAPTQAAELTFRAPGAAEGAARWGYVLRTSGYYEFQAAHRLPVERPGGQLAEQPPVSRRELPGVPEAPA
jgi:hypothetical protein